MAGGDSRGGRRVRAWVEKHLTNPPMRAALRLGVAPRAFALLETTGHRTGRRRLTPVGNGLDGGVFWLVSEKGRRAGYVANLLAEPRVRVKIGRRWLSGRAALVPEEDAMARRERIDARNGIVGRFDGVIFRASAGPEPVAIRIDLEQTR